jgi:hypothetical protein
MAHAANCNNGATVFRIVSVSLFVLNCRAVHGATPRPCHSYTEPDVSRSPKVTPVATNSCAPFEQTCPHHVRKCVNRVTTQLLLLGLCLASASAATTDLFLSPSGNDSWTGTKSKATPAKTDGPLKTIPVALKVARELRKQNPSNSIQIILEDGTYELSDPISLIPEDSAPDKDHPLLITAAHPGRAIVSGGRHITGWKRAANSPSGLFLWEADLPDVREGKWYFRELFINGQRKQRARTPNTDFFHIDGANPLEKPAKVHFKGNDIKKEWADAGDVELIAYLAWTDLRMLIRSVDETNHLATLSGNPHSSIHEDNAQYYIENAPDALDAAGEWYLDKKTGVLKYLADTNQDISKAEVIAPSLDDLLTAKGDLEHTNFVQNITLRGLAFSYTNWKLPENGYADSQAAVSIRGDLFLEAARDVRLENCSFTHLAGYALDLAKGAQRCTVSHCNFSDIGGGGIRIGEPGRPQNSVEENHSHIISDNEIQGLGRVYAPAVGVLILQSGTNRIAHNNIHDLYYTAVSVGWTWGYKESPCRENIIEFNHLYNIGQNRLSDMGAVYTLGPQPGTIVRNNLIHDVNSFTYGGWGLYPDEGSTDIIFENNIVYHCKSAGFHQHYGRENIVRNNIFALNREHQLMRTREEAHSSFTFTNNIVYFDSGDLLGSNWSNEHFTIDHNLYFDARNPDAPDKTKFAGASLDEWKKRGHDEHSLIANPLFVAPEKGDFRLKKESPPLKLGFQQIDITQIGPRGK